MFKKLIGLAASALTVSAQKVEDTAEVQCQAIVTTDGTIFSITGLESETFYSKAVGSTSDQLQFNYCTYGNLEDDAYGLVKKASGDNLVVASKNISWTKAKNLEDDNEKNIGVTFYQKSGTKCTEDANYSMRTNLYCDKSVTAKGGAEVTSVSLKDCEYIVNLKHKAGCPTVDLDVDTYLGWLSENEWAIGIIYLVIGPLVALFGTAWFPYVTAALVAIFVIGVVVSISLAFSWMVTTTGTIVTLSVALVLGIIAGCVIRRKVFIMIGLLGLVGGFFGGTLIYAIIFSTSGW